MTATVFRSLEEACRGAKPCALAIGNFDGVHLGHQALLRKAVETAGANVSEPNKEMPAVLTFDPHPTTIVAPERIPLKIYSLEQRLDLQSEYGAQQVTVLPFTAEVSRLSAREFVEQILVRGLRVQTVVVGENFRFGFGQSGDISVLSRLGEQFGFQAFFLPPVLTRGEVVSSSAIRRYLLEGKVVRANRMLGRCFALQGPVVSGFGIGSKQTVPTLNLRPASHQVIPRGVFITETVDSITGKRWQSITNSGFRPTFSGEELTVETFILSPFEPPAPAQISVEFRRFVRSERAFPNPQELRAQILRDVARAQAYWRRVAVFGKPAASIY